MKHGVWSDDEIEYLRAHYPHELSANVAKVLNRDCKSVWSKAFRLGIRKTEEFLQSEASGCIKKGEHRGFLYRFQKGMTVWNKGMKGITIGGVETQFKKGQMPKNHKPVGSERFSKDGYLEVKVEEPRKWKMKHVINWEQLHGKVPKGYIVVMKDKCRTNVSPENLELISRVENMKRNTIHRYPPELKSAIRAVNKLKNTINEKQDSRLTQPSF